MNLVKVTNFIELQMFLLVTNISILLLTVWLISFDKKTQQDIALRSGDHSRMSFSLIIIIQTKIPSNLNYSRNPLVQISHRIIIFLIMPLLNRYTTLTLDDKIIFTAISPNYSDIVNSFLFTFSKFLKCNRHNDCDLLMHTKHLFGIHFTNTDLKFHAFQTRCAPTFSTYVSMHDDFMTWKRFLHRWQFVKGKHQLQWIPFTMGEWCRVLIPLLLAWTRCWTKVKFPMIWVATTLM